MNNDENSAFIQNEKHLKSDNNKKITTIKSKRVRNDIVQRKPNRSALMKFLQNVPHQRIIYKRKICITLCTLNIT